MVVEKLEVEAGVEDVFDFWSDADNFCAFVRTAEQTRRVDLSGSRWFLKGPPGRSKEFEPETFRGCLQLEHLRSGVPREASADARERAEAFFGSARWADAVLERGEIDLTYLSSGKTLLVLTAYLADHARALEAGPGRGRPEHGGPGDPDDDLGAVRAALNLDLRAVFAHVLPASWSGNRERLWENLAAASHAAHAGGGSGMTEEDRAWLETDLSRLGEYDPYELAEEQLAGERPIRYVPGLGLVVEDDGESDD